MKICFNNTPRNTVSLFYLIEIVLLTCSGSGFDPWQGKSSPTQVQRHTHNGSPEPNNQYNFSC